MKNIKNLTGIYLKQLFSNLFRLKKKTDTGKIVLTVVGLAVLFGYLAFSMVTMYLGFAAQLEQKNMGQFVLLIASAYSALLLLVFMAYQLQGYFFKSKDHDILAAMPIKPYEIIVAKFVSTLIFSYFYLLLFFAPVIGAMFYLNLLNFLGAVYVVIGFFFMPMFILLLGTLIAYLFYFISDWLASIQWLKTVLLFALILGFMGLYFVFSNQIIASILLAGKIPVYFYILLPLDSVWYLSVSTGSAGWFALFIAGQLLALAVSVCLLTRAYFLVYRAKTKEKRHENGVLSYKPSRPFGALVKQELRHYLNSTMYFFNTFFGMVLLILFALFGLIYFFITPSVATFLPTDLWFGIGVLVFSAFSSLSITTSVSISLEGQMLQVKKSLPFSYQQIVLSKLVMNLVVCLPVMAAAYLLLLPVMIVLSFSVLQLLVLLFVPVVVLLTFSMFGLMTNLWFPKMQFNNETEVVKQSLSVMISTLSSMAFMGAVAALYVPAAAVMSTLVYTATVTGVFLVLLALLSWGVLKKGRVLFEQL